MLYPPIVSLTALTVAFLLAVFKPSGRIRCSVAQQGDSTAPPTPPQPTGTPAR
jgi:hypothetical protein